MVSSVQVRVVIVVTLFSYCFAQGTCGLRPPPGDGGNEGDEAPKQCGTTCGLRPPPSESADEAKPAAGSCGLRPPPDSAEPAGHVADLDGDGKVTAEEFVEFASAQAGAEKKESQNTGPLELTAENFDALTAGANAAFVKFFAPWCKHCRDLAKPYSDLANTVHTKYTGLKVGTVNCDEQKEFCEMFQIQGLPTLLLMKSPEAFEDATPILYEGDRDLESILKFLEEQGVLAPAA